MKYRVLLPLYIGFFGLITACSSPSTAPPDLERQCYELTGSGRCDTTKNRGLDIAVSYFLLKDDSKAARQINDSLRRLATGTVTGWLGTDSESMEQRSAAQTDVAKAAALLAADYNATYRDGLSGCWELKSKADTTFSSPKLLSVQFESYAYTGGAHPNSNVSLYTFDRQTGRSLTLADLVTDTTALLSVVEGAFRADQELKPQDNLEERGYFLQNGHFPMPANVGMGRDGMIFYYNPYEVAAYAVGPIELTVPYAQLKHVLRDEWL